MKKKIGQRKRSIPRKETKPTPQGVAMNDYYELEPNDQRQGKTISSELKGKLMRLSELKKKRNRSGGKSTAKEKEEDIRMSSSRSDKRLNINYL